MLQSKALQSMILFFVKHTDIVDLVLRFPAVQPHEGRIINPGVVGDAKGLAGVWCALAEIICHGQVVMPLLQDLLHNFLIQLIHTSSRFQRDLVIGYRHVMSKLGERSGDPDRNNLFTVQKQNSLSFPAVLHNFRIFPQ